MDRLLTTIQMIASYPTNQHPFQELLSMLARLSHLTQLSFHFDRDPDHRRVDLLPDDKAGTKFVEKAFRYLIKHSRGLQFKSLRFYYGSPRDWDVPEAYHQPRSIFHFTPRAQLEMVKSGRISVPPHQRQRSPKQPQPLNLVRY